MGVDPAVTKAVLVNSRVRHPEYPWLSDRVGRVAARPLASNVNAVARSTSPTPSRPGRCERWILVYSYSTADVVIDVLGYFNVAPGAVSRRFVAVAPDRISDTRQPLSATNQYRGVGAAAVRRVPVAGRGGLPAVAAMDAAVLVVTAVTNPGDVPGSLSASPGGSPFSGSSHLNTNGAGDQRPNLVVVPVAADGTVDLHLFAVPDVVEELVVVVVAVLVVVLILFCKATVALVGGLIPRFRVLSRRTCMMATSTITSGRALSRSPTNFSASAIWSGVPRTTSAPCDGSG
jgi:hypothetical protein